jgi:hypothetical protein
MALSLDDLDEDTRETVKDEAEAQEREERIKKQEEHYFQEPVFESETYRDGMMDRDALHRQVDKDEENIEHLRDNPDEYIKKSGEGAMFSPIQIAEDTVKREFDVHEGNNTFWRARDAYKEQHDVSKEEAGDKIRDMVENDKYQEAMEYAIRGRASLIQRDLEASDDMAAISRDQIPDEYLNRESPEGNNVEVRGETFYVSKDAL